MGVVKRIVFALSGVRGRELSTGYVSVGAGSNVELLLGRSVLSLASYGAPVAATSNVDSFGGPADFLTIDYSSSVVVALVICAILKTSGAGNGIALGDLSIYSVMVFFYRFGVCHSSGFTGPVPTPTLSVNLN